MNPALDRFPPQLQTFAEELTYLFVKEFVAYHSRWRLSLMFASSVGFIALGMWLVGMFGEFPSFSEPPRRRRIPTELIPIVGWVCILFFGSCAAVVGKRFFDEKPQLCVGSAGVVWSPWSDQIIPWSEVTDIKSWHYMGQACIVLHLERPDRFPGRGLAVILAKSNQRLTGGDIAISMTGTNSTFAEAMSAIAHFRDCGSRI